MKLLVVQLVIFICLVITILIEPKYSCIPLVAMIIPAVLITALACNWPILGLWAARFEYGKELGRMVVDEKLHVDNNYITWGKQTIRAVHVKRHGNFYKVWYLSVGSNNLQPITSITV